MADPAPATDALPPPSTAPLPCPLCAASPMRSRPKGKSAPASRTCPKCQAEFRERDPGRWTLEYLDPDWFHRAPSSRPAPPLLQTRLWEEWTTSAVSNVPPSATPALEKQPPGLEPGEVVRQAFRPVRIVQPLTHQAWHADGVDGEAWVTDRALRVSVGDFRWAVPLSDLRTARNAAGMVEIVAGATEEPVHLLLAQPERLIALLK